MCSILSPRFAGHFSRSTHSIKSKVECDDNGNSALRIKFGLEMGSISPLFLPQENCRIQTAEARRGIGEPPRPAHLFPDFNQIEFKSLS